MKNFNNVDTRVYTLEEVHDLPKERPFGSFDLDGTLTIPGSELLLESYIQDDKEVGSTDIRTTLENRFKQYKEGMWKYEHYLVELGKLWAQLHATVGSTRADVKERCEKWFQRTGYEKVKEYAQPMMSELERFKFNRLMITGAPSEIAEPFAKFIGIEHVFAMMADVDSSGVYTGKMQKKRNTGLLTTKNSVCDVLAREYATGFGAGDKQSDGAIFETAMNCRRVNPIDIEGRAFIMNPNDKVFENIMNSSLHHLAGTKLRPMFDYFSTERVMEEFRNALRGVYLDNKMDVELHEIEGVRPAPKA
jgi:phosphoserine phosphatase